MSTLEYNTAHVAKVERTLTHTESYPEAPKCRSKPQIPMAQPSDLLHQTAEVHWRTYVVCDSDMQLIMTSVAPAHLPDFRDDKTFSKVPQIRVQLRPDSDQPWAEEAKLG